MDFNNIDIPSLIMGFITGFLTGAGKTLWNCFVKFCKYFYEKLKNIKKQYKEYKNAKEILFDYKKLKENNQKYKDQAIRYNLWYNEQCDNILKKQIKDKYGDELIEPKILQEKWLDDNNTWQYTIKHNGQIYSIQSIGPDTQCKNIWQAWGKLNIYD